MFASSAGRGTAVKAAALATALGTKQTRAMTMRAAADVLKELGLSSTEVNAGVFDGKKWEANGPVHAALNPSTGEVLGKVQFGDRSDYERSAANAVAAQEAWQLTPAPVRGDIVRQIGDALRSKKEALGSLLSLEMGKIFPEGCGEVQEYIDICDLACGMSRQLPGQIVPSERADHILMETWNPVGTIGVITAFNFPHAVFGWNSAVSMICGNTQLVKGAESSALVTTATQRIVTEVLEKNGVDPAVAVLVMGEGSVVGEAMLQDKRINLVSFTGSTKVGAHANQVVSARGGRTILELGGNNASVVMPSADMEGVLQSVVFGAAGTCGQRCTSLRRLLLHESIYDDFVAKLSKAYTRLPYGHPLHSDTLIGPMHNAAGVELFERTVKEALSQGGELLAGGVRLSASELPSADLAKGNFVKPALIAIDPNAPIVQEERFVPVLYVCKVPDLETAIKVNNQVEQGLSSSIFTNDMREVFHWLGPRGTDCGIRNVNCSSSGAEIGLGFGGEKSTSMGSGSRESGSDAWKQYMKRGTCTICYGGVKLAQGINFNLGD